MATVYTLILSSGDPEITVAEETSLLVGPGRSDRHNQSIPVQLSDGGIYLLLRDARYRARGWGKAMSEELRRLLGRPEVSGWSGHPDHLGTWDLWRLTEPLEVEAGQQNRWRLRVGGEATLVRVVLTV